MQYQTFLKMVLEPPKHIEALVNIIYHFNICIYIYISDSEDKLQTYNEINGAIRRHFGKQMNKETKFRIYNITAEAALKFGSEDWVLKEREEQRL